VHLLDLVLIRHAKEVEMSIRRLVVTVATMAAIAAALAALTPPFAELTGSLTAAQRTVDTQGADVLIASTAGLLAWAVWAWGALGLALTAASALPGVAGGAARRALQVALPAGARRSAALLLGLGLGVAGPLLASAVPQLAPIASAAAAAAAESVPDWPAPSPAAAPVPDWPTEAAPTGEAPAAPSTAPTAAPAADSRVVVRGDCLWHIAADSLLGQLGRLPSDGEVAAAVQAWWSANADVIGPDPDLLVPGQVLRPPGPP
jgi:nucleoid-associated protein YgaU